MIYLDEAATSLYKAPAVKTALIRALESFGSPNRSTHAPALEASRALHRCRHQLSKLFHAPSAAHVCLGNNATWALNTAIRGLHEKAEALKIKLWVISSAASHNSLLRPLYRVAQPDKGAQLSILAHEHDGSLDYTKLDTLLDKTRQNMASQDILLLALNHASNVTGEIYELERLSMLAQKYAALLLIDAAQTAGICEIDMQAHTIDYLCFTGHKSLRGPQGTGGLVLSQQAPLPYALCVGGSGFNSQDRQHPQSLPEALEAGTANAHGFAGLSAALDELPPTLSTLAHKAQEKRRYLWEALSKLDRHGLTLYGKAEGAHSGCLVCAARSIPGSQFADLLYRRYEICTRSGSFCAPLMLESLQVHQGLVRMSFSPQISYEELDFVARACQELLS